MGALAAAAVLGWIYSRKIEQLREKLKNAEVRANSYGSRPITISREERDIVRIVAQTIVPNDVIVADPWTAGECAREELQQELMKGILRLCEIKIAENPCICSKVVRAELKAVPPKKTVSLEELMVKDCIRAKGREPMANFSICEGNPGALQFLMAAYELDIWKAEKAFRKMQDNGITGARLYMLWNDCCGRDTAQALQIAYIAPVEKIVEHINYKGGRGIPFDEVELAGLC